MIVVKISKALNGFSMGSQDNPVEATGDCLSKALWNGINVLTNNTLSNKSHFNLDIRREWDKKSGIAVVSRPKHLSLAYKYEIVHG